MIRLWEKILLCSYYIEQGGESLFTLNDLVVKCWLNYPREFGMEGYETKYPDKESVRRELYRRPTPFENKMLGQQEDSRLFLLPAGRQRAILLEQQIKNEADTLSESMLERMLGSTAHSLFLQGMKEMIQLNHVILFWGWPKQVRDGMKHDRDITKSETEIAKLQAITRKQCVTFANGREVSIADADDLHKAAMFLRGRFRLQALRLKG